MVVEAVQTYVNLVNGLTRATRERARATARGLLAQVGLERVADDVERRAGRLTDEIISAGRANGELIENLLAGEVTKAASRWGFVRSDDLDEVREEIAELRAQLARQQAGTATSAARTAASDTPSHRVVPDPDADAGA
jgi:polyhydroxyalkanoate synthesis regulator phasin